MRQMQSTLVINMGEDEVGENPFKRWKFKFMRVVDDALIGLVAFGS